MSALAIVHGDQTYDAKEVGRLMRQDVDPERWREIIADGELWQDDDRLPRGRAEAIRSTLLGSYAGKDWWATWDYDEAARGRMLIPDLQPFGTIPALGGSPKVGKTHVVVDYAATLMLPGHKFLGRFGPVELTPEERRQNVVLINAEHPRDDLHEMLLDAGFAWDVGNVGGVSTRYYYAPGGPEDWGVLVVYHLEHEPFGTADLGDFTNPGTYAMWRYLLMQCPCLGDEDPSRPLAVIADGVTAMVNVDFDKYGKWFLAFRELLRETDIPNGLAVGHAGLDGNHLMGATASTAGPDGNWIYKARDPDRPGSRREFWVQGRGRAPSVDPTRVRIDGGGRLMIDPPKAAPDSGPEADRTPAPASGEERAEEDVRERLRGKPRQRTVDVTGRGEDGKWRRSALNRMLERGEVKMEREGRQTMLWSLVSDTQPDIHDIDDTQSSDEVIVDFTGL